MKESRLFLFWHFGFIIDFLCFHFLCLKSILIKPKRSAKRKRPAPILGFFSFQLLSHRPTKSWRETVRNQDLNVGRCANCLLVRRERNWKERSPEKIAAGRLRRLVPSAGVSTGGSFWFFNEVSSLGSALCFVLLSGTSWKNSLLFS
jgi:hypothetical protein